MPIYYTIHWNHCTILEHICDNKIGCDKFYLQTFSFDRKIDMDHYYKVSWLGMKKYYFKDGPKEERSTAVENEATVGEAHHRYYTIKIKLISLTPISSSDEDIGDVPSMLNLYEQN